MSKFRRIKKIKLGSRSRMRVANTHRNFSPLRPLEQKLWGEEVRTPRIKWILFCEKVEEIKNFRRIYQYKCGSRSHMSVANTENRFQPPRTSTHRNIHTWRTFKFTKWKKNWIFFEKVEKMNNLRRIFKQKCGSRSRMRGVNIHNTFQTPRSLRTEGIRLGSQWN